MSLNKHLHAPSTSEAVKQSSVVSAAKLEFWNKKNQLIIMKSLKRLQTFLLEARNRTTIFEYFLR